MTTYKAFENWGTWVVLEFADGKGGRIVEEITGNGYSENERLANEAVAKLTAEYCDSLGINPQQVEKLTFCAKP